MSIDEMIAVLQAAKAGKELQRRIIPGMACAEGPKWEPMREGDRWQFQAYDYRVAPEPREVWADVHPGHTVHNAYNSKEAFNEAHEFANFPLNPRCYREVMEDEK